jgi:hypothetical protein
MPGEFTTEQRWTFVARAVISIVILSSGIYVIMHDSYSDAVVKWAIGAVGVVIGYWLR